MKAARMEIEEETKPKIKISTKNPQPLALIPEFPENETKTKVTISSLF